MYVTSCGTGQYTAGETHVQVQHRLYKNPVKRAVLLPRGSGGTGLTYAFDANFGLPLLQRLCDDGLFGITADFGGANTWGNDTSRTTVGQVWTFAQSSFNAKPDKMLLLAGSMGALVAINYARQNPTKVAALALYIPITDLQDAHDNRGFAAVIESAYGGLAGYQAALASHSPILNPADAASVPVRMWYSTDDPYAVQSTVTAYQTAIANAGGSISSVSMGAQGHAMNATAPKQMADWLLGFG